MYICVKHQRIRKLKAFSEILSRWHVFDMD